MANSPAEELGRSGAKDYLVGDDIASKAVAVFIIRDGEVKGRHITQRGPSLDSG